MKYEDKKSYQYIGSCCSGFFLVEIESKICCFFFLEVVFIEEFFFSGIKSYEYSYSCCLDVIVLMIDKSQYFCCSDYDIVLGDSDIEEMVEYCVYGMDCFFCVVMIEKSLKILNDI